jgi:hypothetical protein
MKLIFTYFLLAFSVILNAQTVQLHPTINSIGVEVQLPSGYDVDKTARCFFKYKKLSESEWKDGFEADRILMSGIDQFRGSIFFAEDNSGYEVEITLMDSIPNITSQVLPIANAFTWSNPQFNQMGNIKWVAPNGSGTLYTEANPGKLTTLLSSGGVTCGTTVLFMDGIYTDVGLALQIYNHCTEKTPIQFFAAPGSNPVIDGGVTSTLSWTPNANIPNLYSASLPTGTEYSNLCLIDGNAIYAYPTLTANIWFGNYNLVDLNFGFDGFVRNNSGIWLHTQSGINPNNFEVTLSKAFRFLALYGNNKDAYLRIKGITFQHFAKPSFSGNSEYSATVFDIRGAHQITFEDCHFLYNNSHISFSSQCNNIIIQNCEFKHSNGIFSHAMIKKSLITSALEPTSRGRAIETGAIELGTNKNVIIRNNTFDGVNSSVIGVTQIEEADIYENLFLDNFDAIECDGNWSNLRVWNNEIVRPMAGFSMAPPMIGPRYFYRNVVHSMQGRRNEQDDPYFVGCQPPVEYVSAGVGIKTNPGVAGNIGNLYFINNTFYADDELGFVFTSWDSEWRMAKFINNIYADQNKQVGYFHSLGNNSDYQFYSENDNYFSENSAAPLLVAKEMHGQYNCIDVETVEDIQTTLSAISGSNAIQIVQPYHLNPEFVTTTQGGFFLSENSPVINQGIVVNGFYDFVGLPDLGAKESEIILSSFDASAEIKVQLFPNPASEVVNFSFPAKMKVKQITISNNLGQLVDMKHSFSSTSNISYNIKHLHKGIYFVTLYFENGQKTALKFIKA